MTSISDFLKEIYGKLPLNNNIDGTFYDFINSIFTEFLDGLETIPEHEFTNILFSRIQYLHFVEPYTKRRFIHFLQRLCDDFLQVLAFCYKGQTYQAHQLLSCILSRKRYRRYLIEEYRNYFHFKYPEGHYYRMRDVLMMDENGEQGIVDNCWHVPFNMRFRAYTGRYSLLGFPCLYLASDKKTSDAELGRLRKGYNRWVSEFCFNRFVLLYDLRIPKPSEFNTDGYQLFCYLLQYPLIALCSSTKKNEGFNEEYYIPQLLFHHIVAARNERDSFKGIAYSSTIHPSGFNIILPALYEGNVPPCSGYSNYLESILVATPPVIYSVSSDGEK